METSFKRFVATVVIPIVFVICILLSLPLVCGHGHSHDHHGHSHDHHGHSHDHHHHEPAAYKWSKQANAQYQDELEDDHEHIHDHHHHHGHTHDHHGHTHGHSHDHHSHSHTHHDHEEPAAYKWSKQANENHQEEEKGDVPPKAKSPSPKQSVWLEAICATVLISIAPYLILFFIPVTNSKEHEPYLKILLAFASGGLLGDAFLHLIPHALMAQAATGGSDKHSHSHSHSHGTESEGGHGHDMGIGLAVLGGIIVFLVVEKFVRIFKGSHSHSHSHSHTVSVTHADNSEEEKDDDKSKNDKNKEDEAKDTSEEKKDENSKEEDTAAGEGDIRVAGYLNLAADFTHNLTDGLAIGASFLAGKSVGTVTTITIFLHEIPHEIGDFAILLQSGCSRRKAMMLQLVTAVGAITGTLISLLAEGADDSAIAWILPFTAGGFIYIATVSVIPELLENTRFWQSIFEVVALLSGVGLMMAIAHLEEMGHEH